MSAINYTLACFLPYCAKISHSRSKWSLDLGVIFFDKKKYFFFKNRYKVGAVASHTRVNSYAPECCQSNWINYDGNGWEKLPAWCLDPTGPTILLCHIISLQWLIDWLSSSSITWFTHEVRVMKLRLPWWLFCALETTQRKLTFSIARHIFSLNAVNPEFFGGKHKVNGKTS